MKFSINSLLALSLKFAYALIWSMGYANPALATTVCPGDGDGINNLHQLGQVVTSLTSSSSTSSCNYKYRLKFETPRVTQIVCSPTNQNNIPSGYVITAKTTCDKPNSFNDVIGYEITRSLNAYGQTVCNISPIPEGYVVYRTEGNYQTDDSSTCTDSLYDDGYNLIKIPSNNYSNKTTKCEYPNHPIPNGFVIREKASLSQCGGAAQKISVPNPNATMTVCSGSKIPPGFAYTDVYDDSLCAVNGSGPAFDIGQVSGSQATICGNSLQHVPSGYVVAAINPYIDCAEGYDSLSIAMPISSGSYACKLNELDEYSVPEGYVIDSLENNVISCGGHTRYHIKVPSGSQQFVCEESTVPSGWGVTATYSNNPTCAGKPAATIEPLGGDGPYTICANDSVPEGYVIRKLITAWTCKNTVDEHALEIVRPNQTPGTETTVCAMGFDEIPMGFIISEQKEYGNCTRNTGSTFPGFRITRPFVDRKTIICTVSTIPTGFGIELLRNDYSDCSLNKAYEINLISGPGPLTVCDAEAIPPGYVVTQIQQNSDYCGFVGGYVIEQPDFSNGTTVCAATELPEGVVIKELVSTDACPFDQGWKVAYPNSNGSTIVCLSSPIPQGFIKTSYGEKGYGQCSYGNDTGPGFVIIPISSGGVVPSPFVNTEPNIDSPPDSPSLTCSSGTINGGLIGTASINTHCNNG